MKLFFNVDKKQRKRGRHSKKRTQWHHHMSEYLWPSLGGRAFLRLTEIRMKRAKGSAYSIVMGLAIGVFVSFTPYIGLHSAIGLLLCLLLRSNIVMMIIGTLAGNPWTFPLIWVTTLELGNLMLGRTGTEAYSMPETFSLSEITANITFYFDAYLLPMTLSGVPLGIIAGAITFFIIYENIILYRKARSAYLKERRVKWIHLKAAPTAVKEKLMHIAHLDGKPKKKPFKTTLKKKFKKK